jgi:hypothetical protein
MSVFYLILSMCSACTGGADADGCDYAAALGQKMALRLGQAADDVAAVFGAGGGAGASADLAAAFLVWALHEVERWAGNTYVCSLLPT